MRKYFGTDGVRGRANIEPLTADFAIKLGRAAAGLFKNNSDTHRKIVIGKDTRLSCYMFENALVAGICSAGIDAVMVGVLPTPAIAFLTKSLRADAGVVISASHNPYYDNGIKFFNANGYKLADVTELEIERMIDEGEPKLSSEKIGKASRIETAIGRYVEFVKNTFSKSIDLKGLKIVLDCANGAAYRVAPMALKELGAELVLLNVEPNGTNINHNCGAVHPENMAAEVVKHGAHIGISFDGDADRVMFADERGCIVDGDKIMGVCALEMMKENRLNNNSIVATVMSNIGFERSMNKQGISLIRSDVGDRYVMEAMAKHGCNLGGEQSGHLIFSDYNTTGDGLISAMQLLSSIIKSGKNLSELASFIETYPQVLKNASVKCKIPIDNLKNTSILIKNAEDKLSSSGRVLVRYSGTENKIRVMIEGRDQSLIDTMASEIAESAVKEINALS
ncbi:MAG: phosphoglucosamine mutase [Deferribacterales bacterium]|nr:phosphoglucosamine mutase [Deferribacterales bacterium]